MKKFSIIAMVLAFTMMLSVVSYAAPAFKTADGAVIPEGTTVTPAADSIAVETAATAGNYYGILLVEGNALPTVDNAILYINQATAADVKQAFEVLPNMAGLEDGTELTLYISSNVANANLIAIPMVYADEVIIPDGPAFPLGDVTMDEYVDLDDAYVMFLFAAMETDRIIEEGYPQFWGEVSDDDADAVALGDVTMDEYADLDDAYVMFLYAASEEDRIIEEGYPEFWAE